MRVAFILIWARIALAIRVSAVEGMVQEPQLDENAPQRAVEDLRLDDIPLRQTVELIHIDLPAEQAEVLFERGLLPGCRICPVRSSPSGDPIVSVDGTILAIRREIAQCLCVRLLTKLQEAG